MKKQSIFYIIFYHSINLIFGFISIHLLSITFNYLISPFLYLTIGIIYLLIEFLKFYIQSYAYKSKPNLMLSILFFVLCAFSLSSNYLAIDRINNYEIKVHNQFKTEQNNLNRIENDKLYIDLHKDVQRQVSLNSKGKDKIIKQLNLDFHSDIEKNNSKLNSLLESKKPFQIRIKNIIFLFIVFEMLSISAYFNLSYFSKIKYSEIKSKIISNQNQVFSLIKK